MAKDGSTSLITRATDSIVFFNPSYQDMSRPIEGPTNPWNDRKLTQMNILTGTTLLSPWLPSPGCALGSPSCN